MELSEAEYCPHLMAKKENNKTKTLSLVKAGVGVFFGFFLPGWKNSVETIIHF